MLKSISFVVELVNNKDCKLNIVWMCINQML